jgi:hypothetical protein
VKQATRALIAAAAAEKVSGHHVSRVYDHALGRALPVTRHLEAEALREDAEEALVLHLDPQERVSLQVHDDLFSGWDHLTGAYFAGAMVESDVMFYDGYERRYYKFSMH